MSAYSLIRSLSEADEQPEEKDNTDRSVPVLAQFADKLKHAPSGNVRYVLRMSVSDLSALYLKKGGGLEFVKNLTDEQITAFAASPTRTEDAGIEEIEALPQGYTFTQLVTPHNSAHDAVVLLNVPTSITSELEGAKTDVNGARGAIEKMMNHKFYVMTLSASKSLKVAKAVDKAWANLDNLSLQVNPTMVIAYPNQEELADIKDAWGDATNTRADMRDAADAKKLAKARAAPEKPQQAAPAQDGKADAPAAAQPEDESDTANDLQRAYDTLQKYAAGGNSQKKLGEIMKLIGNDLATLKK